MRDYGVLSPLFWIGETGRMLKAKGPEAVIVAVYLVTGPNSNMIGLYHVSKSQMAAETGLGFDGACKGLRWACEVGFCSYDEASEVVFVKEMARFQIADQLKPGDKRVKRVQNLYESVPKNPFLSEFYDYYRGRLRMTAERVISEPAAGGGDGPQMGLLGGTIQEQKQEQDRKEYACVVEVFEYWKAKLNHPRAAIDPTNKNAAKIRARLKEGYSVDDLKRVVDGCLKSPHNMGTDRKSNPSGQVYDAIDLLYRDAQHVDRFMGLAGTAPPPPAAHQQRREFGGADYGSDLQ